MRPAPVDLDALSAQWRAAFNTAQDALRAAGPYLQPDEKGRARRALVEERRETADLLETIAREEHLQLVHRVTAPRPSNKMLGLPSEVVACVFELEGVLTGSATVHAEAWAETFNELLLRHAERAGERYGPFVPFNPRTDYPAHIHGRPRLEGVRAFLASRGIRLPEGTPGDPPTVETVHGVANRKNLALLRRLDANGVSAYASSKSYLEAARDAGLLCAVVSASANTRAILERAGLARLVDERVDGNTIVADHLRVWPEPDVLLAACEALAVQPERTAVFETMPAGVAAGRAAHFDLVVGVNRTGEADVLRQRGADVVVDGLDELLDPVLSAP